MKFAPYVEETFMNSKLALNLLSLRKLKCYVEKFDATGATKAHVLNTPNPIPPSMNKSWVTVSPKKRVKAMI